MTANNLYQELIGYIDLTSLNTIDTEETINQLCMQAQTPLGPVAAVCVLPQFIKQAKLNLENTPVKIATVANFPSGDESLKNVLTTINQALEDGADEIDIVFPYEVFLAGDLKAPRDFLQLCRQAVGNKIMKVILETGAYPDTNKITQAAKIVVEEGGDFLKTSTGKIPAGATPAAAEALLHVIDDYKTKHQVGFKVSGGVRTFEDAYLYRDLVEKICGEAWLTPTYFRFGASQLLSNILSIAKGTTEKELSNY